MSRIISLAERKRKLRQEIESLRSPTERAMDNKLDKLVEALDDLQDRMQELELRQAQLVRLLNELVARLETDE